MGRSSNGVPVRERDLEPGDRISVGSTLFLFLLAADAEEPADDRNAVLWDDGSYAAGTTLQAPRSAFPIWSPPPRTRDLRALLRIGNALHALRSTGELARRLLELILETIPAERATLLLLDRGGEADHLLRPGADTARPIPSPCPAPSSARSWPSARPSWPTTSARPRSSARRRACG